MKAAWRDTVSEFAQHARAAWTRLILEHLGLWAPEAAGRVRPPPSSGPPKRSSP